MSAFVKAATPPDEPLQIMEDGVVRAVVLSFDAYTALVDRLEDLADSLSVLEARASDEQTRPLDDYLRDREYRQETRVSR